MCTPEEMLSEAACATASARALKTADTPAEPATQIKVPASQPFSRSDIEKIAQPAINLGRDMNASKEGGARQSALLNNRQDTGKQDARMSAATGIVDSR